MGGGVYVTQIPGTEGGVWFTPLPKVYLWGELQPPTVESGLLMSLVVAAFPSQCSMNFQQNDLHSDSCLRGLPVGEPKQRHAPLLSPQSLSPKDSWGRKHSRCKSNSSRRRQDCSSRTPRTWG